ncbi:Cytoplasmic dynein 1 light intermediate chain 2 [Boothiomyces sp. JEL0838]|nr:Cytoplasmic dynein 1 light intermediate chain 2 [Boothiomyces sp. JEL0838]
MTVEQGWSDLFHPPEKQIHHSITIIGSRNCGMNEFLNSLCKEEIKDVEPLYYSFVEIEVEEEVHRMSCYGLINDDRYSDLLKITNPSIIGIYIDYSKPYDILNQLKSSFDIIEQHVQGIDITELQKRTESLYKKYQQQQLGEGVLLKNLGIPIVLVGANVMTLQEEYFDFIQQITRTIALKYGAGVIYSLDILDFFYSTLHQLEVKSQIVGKEIKIPIGWDSYGKILAVNQDFATKIYSQDWDTIMSDFQTVISPPLMNIVKPQLILPENEQDFLEKQFSLMGTEEPRDKLEIQSHKEPLPKEKPEKENPSVKIQKLLEKNSSLLEKMNAQKESKPQNTEMLNSFFKSLLDKTAK